MGCDPTSQRRRPGRRLRSGICLYDDERLQFVLRASGLTVEQFAREGVHAAMPHVAALRSRGLRAAGLARQIRKTRCVQICVYRTASAIRS